MRLAKELAIPLLWK